MRFVLTKDVVKINKGDELINKGVNDAIDGVATVIGSAIAYGLGMVQLYYGIGETAIGVVKTCADTASSMIDNQTSTMMKMYSER